MTGYRFPEKMFSDKLMEKIRSDPELYKTWNDVQEEGFWKGWYNTIYLWAIYGILPRSVREPLEQPFRPDADVQQLLVDVAEFNIDDKVYEIHRWVYMNIRYESDQLVWHQPEYWQSPQQTMELRTGDCEDFTMLFLKICELAEVPDWRVFACVGRKSTASVDMSKDFNHCWPHYITEQGFREVDMDLTFLASIAHPLSRPYALDNQYAKFIAFKFNKNYARKYRQ